MGIKKILKKNHFDKDNNRTYDQVLYECDRCKKEQFITITPIGTNRYCFECSKIEYPHNYR